MQVGSIMTQQNPISRRSLIQGFGIGAAATTASCLVATAFAEEAAEEWSQESDLIVVGFGAAGAAAAIEAIEAGASVLVVERAGRGGGSTIRSGGMLYMGGTQLQKDLGVEDSAENMLAYVTEVMGVHSNPKMLEHYCNNSGDLYDWCVSHGMVFEGTVDNEGYDVLPKEGVCLMYAGNERAWDYAQIATPAPRGHRPNGGGFGIFEALEGFVEVGAEVLYNTVVTGLIVNDANAVIGVVAVDEDGNELRLKANKGVLISCGGFAMNETMLHDYMPDMQVVPPEARTATENDTGSGILMGMKVGAATKSMSTADIAHFIYRYGEMPCGIMVDSRGHRFLGEDWYGTWIGSIVEHYSPDKCFVVVDAVANEHVADGLGWQDLVPAAEADTIEDLAAQLDIEPGNLVASVERYNGLVAAGEDTDYHKVARFLKEIATPPFYAYDFSISQSTFMSLGGLKINEEAQVIDGEGNPIDGLYAAGRSSCGIFGRYIGSGCSIGDSLTFGRVAGKSIASR